MGLLNQLVDRFKNISNIEEKYEIAIKIKQEESPRELIMDTWYFCISDEKLEEHQMENITENISHSETEFVSGGIKLLTFRDTSANKEVEGKYFSACTFLYDSDTHLAVKDVYIMNKDFKVSIGNDGKTSIHILLDEEIDLIVRKRI